ncbi:hypothetical protein DIZ76_017328 [Coccidioides immitis]|nr:hypothetical protein DIZ76_017328 [Coccidioides immitis]
MGSPGDGYKRGFLFLLVLVLLLLPYFPQLQLRPDLRLIIRSFLDLYPNTIDHPWPSSIPFSSFTSTLACTARCDCLAPASLCCLPLIPIPPHTHPLCPSWQTSAA